MRFFYRLPEPNGRWSEWYECSAYDFRYYQNDPNIDTRVEE